jgi:hypothetical protein
MLRLPGEADTVKFGGPVEGVLSDTLSKVAVAKDELVPLFTAKPTYTVCAMLIVWLAPNGTQFTPSVDV